MNPERDTTPSRPLDAAAADAIWLRAVQLARAIASVAEKTLAVPLLDRHFYPLPAQMLNM